jgi:hypothetical protein
MSLHQRQSPECLNSIQAANRLKSVLRDASAELFLVQCVLAPGLGATIPEGAL